MIYVRLAPFSVVPWPFGMGTFGRMCNDAPPNVADLAELVYDRLLDVPSVNRSWQLINVTTEFGKTVGSLAEPLPYSYNKPARLTFTFGRQAFKDYGNPRSAYMANMSVKHWSRTNAGEPDFVTIRVTPSECSTLGCTDMSIRAMNAYYYAVGAIVRNRLMQSNLNRGMSPVDAMSTVRQHAYEDWGWCEGMWTTPLLSRIHIERNPIEGIRALMVTPALPYRFVKRYILGANGLGARLRAIIGVERQRRAGVPLPHINRMSDKALSALMISPERYIRKDMAFIRQLLAME